MKEGETCELKIMELKEGDIEKLSKGWGIIYHLDPEKIITDIMLVKEGCMNPTAIKEIKEKKDETP